MAPVNRALNLGRVPRLTARILRFLAKQSLLGSHLLVVGTHSLFAYEARAGVHLSSDLLATADVDFLWDERLSLALVEKDARESGILRLLQRVDRSFQPRRPGDYRAFNRDGFMVDLIRPQDHKTLMRSATRKTVGTSESDPHAAPIEGLKWLVNVPRFEATAMGEDGYPVEISTIDPRAFALHKLWVAQRADRDPLKKSRDRAQAETVAALARTYFGLSLDDPALSGLPSGLRALARSFRASPLSTTSS